jgi:sphingomyelin phosphodiesterase acid-like 3
LARTPKIRFPQRPKRLLAPLFACLIFIPIAHAQNTPALLLSDIHFDPFRDAAKVPQLVTADPSQWSAILSRPNSPDQAKTFAAVQTTCGARLSDTPYRLLKSSLDAIKLQAAQARFVTISGDLLAHEFSCRFTATTANTSPADYAAFVDKTLRFLMLQLKATLPGIPIYIAMGNNDSDCGDYRMDLNDRFFASTASIVALGLPPSPDRSQAIHDFAAVGSYAVTLPSPILNTRLLVIDDLVYSRKYTDCNSKPSPAAIAAQQIWLQGQLASARKQHQRVWIMGHIPPGIDIYSSYSKMKNPCDTNKAVMFLSSEQFTNLLLTYSDTIKLGIFAHTHMDELRLYHPEPSTAASKSFPIKMVASISPVDGNLPSFTLATINPRTATLTDYQLIAASNFIGIDTTWSSLYTYSTAFHQPDLSAASLQNLLAKFQADPTASTPESKAYIDNYFPGDKSSLIKPLWPQYACSLTHNTEQGFITCACAKP